jgi:hypothetical protein
MFKFKVFSVPFEKVIMRRRDARIPRPAKKSPLTGAAWPARGKTNAQKTVAERYKEEYNNHTIIYRRKTGARDYLRTSENRAFFFRRMRHSMRYRFCITEMPDRQGKRR